MRHHSGLGEAEERVARATLTLAQERMPRPLWPDLAAMARRPAQEDSFVLDLPIGSGLIAPLEVGLHFESREARELEAELLTDTVKAHLRQSAITLRRVDRTRRVAETLAAAARDQGAPIEVLSLSLEPQTSAWGFPTARVEVELGLPGPDLEPTSQTTTVGLLKGLRDEMSGLAALAGLRARMHAVLRRRGAVAFIDPVAHSAAAWFGLEPLRILKRLRAHPYAANGMNDANFNPEWRRASLHARFDLDERVAWGPEGLSVRTQIPHTIVASAAGRRLCEIVSHPVLEQVVVADAETHPWGVILRTEQLAPLTLMADGSVAALPDEEREDVSATLSAWSAWFARTGDHR